MPPKGGQNKVVMDELVDVDSFLDSYLAQLQSDGAPAGNQSQNQLQNGPFGDLQTDSLLFGQQQGAPGRFAFIDPNMQVPLGMQVASGAQFGGQQGLAVQQANGAGPSRAAAAAAPGSQNNGRGTRQSTRQRAPKKHLSESPDEVGTSGDDSGEDRKPARKRGEAVDSAEAARRAQALQEKNRRAQRRFRERQKHKIHELHDQIEQLTRKVSQLQTENSSLHNRTGILQKILDMRNEQIQVMQEAKEGSSDRLSAALPESEAGGKLIKLTPEVIKDLTPEQMQVIYQTYVRELSARIGQLRKQDPPDAAGLQDLEELTRDLSMVLFRFTMEKPLDLRKFVVNSRQFLASTEEEVIALWRKMLEQIPPLNDDQKRAIVSQRQAFYRNIEPVMEERRKLNAQIQGELPADTFHTRSALTYIKAHEAVIKLRENLKQEHLVTFDFAQKVLRQTFTLMQVACLLVASFPVVPDALGISSAVAAELGVLHAASSSGGAAAPAGSSAAGGGGAAGGGSGAPGLPHHLHGVVPGVYAMPMNGLMQGGGAGGSGLGLLPSDGTGGLGQTQLQPH